MKFLYPEWVAALVLALALIALLGWTHRRHLYWLHRLFDTQATHIRLAKLRLGFRIAATLLVILALMGPYFSLSRERLTSRQKEIYFLLDASASMNCTDMRPSRLQRSKRLIQGMIRSLEGERMGLVVFTDYGYTVCPLTRDTRLLELFVSLVETRQYGNRGTNFRKGLMECLERFPQQRASLSLSRRYIIMLSDGEHFGEAYQSVINKLKQSGIRLLTIGVGTDQPCAVQLVDSEGRIERVLDEQGRQAISLFRRSDLEFLARETGGRFFRFDGRNDISGALLDYLDEQSASSGEKLLLLQERNWFQSLTLAAFLCWLASLSLLPWRKRVQSS